MEDGTDEQRLDCEWEDRGRGEVGVRACMGRGRPGGCDSRRDLGRKSYKSRLSHSKRGGNS